MSSARRITAAWRATGPLRPTDELARPSLRKEVWRGNMSAPTIGRQHVVQIAPAGPERVPASRFAAVRASEPCTRSAPGRLRYSSGERSTRTSPSSATWSRWRRVSTVASGTRSRSSSCALSGPRISTFQPEPEQAHSLRGVHDVDREVAARERGPVHAVETFHPVLVVPDEDERRAAHHGLVLHADADAHERPPPHHREGGPHGRDPLAQPAGPVSLAELDDTGIDPDAGVVEEIPPVHLAHVHLPLHALRDDADGVRQVQRNAQVLGEVVERAGREDAQRDLAAATTAEATAFTVPSPPAATSTRHPALAAARARWPMSWPSPGTNTVACRPWVANRPAISR